MTAASAWLTAAHKSLLKKLIVFIAGLIGGFVTSQWVPVLNDAAKTGTDAVDALPTAPDAPVAPPSP